MEIRSVTTEEIPQYWELIRYAFRNWQEVPYKDEAGPWFVPEESYGLFDEGRLMAGVVSRRFRQVVRGVADTPHRQDLRSGERRCGNQSDRRDQK